MTEKELVGRTGSDPNTMSEMLARLGKKDLVARERHAEDGVTLALTRHGRQVRASLWERTVALRPELESLFSPERLGRLVRGLGRIATAINPEGVPHPQDLPTRPPALTRSPEC